MSSDIPDDIFRFGGEHLLIYYLNHPILKVLTSWLFLFHPICNEIRFSPASLLYICHLAHLLGFSTTAVLGCPASFRIASKFRCAV
jgi:hypothetical protein